MSSRLAASGEAKKWQMPIVPDSYVRSPLTGEELAALAIASRLGSKARGLTGLDYAKAELQRLQVPIYDVIALRSPAPHRCRRVRRMLYCEMAQRGTTFWEWSQEEWIEIICPTFQEYAKKHGTSGARPALMDIAYLLGGIADLRAVGQKHECTQMARYIFGAERIDLEFKRMTDVLVGQKGRGYSNGGYMQELKQSFCLVLLLNRSPYLEDLTEGTLQRALTAPHPLTASHGALMREVLQELSILPPRPKELPSIHLDSLDTSGVPSEWVEWCLAWLKQDTDLPLNQRRRHFTNLMMDGRWLADQHPGIVSPDQWDEPLAMEYVNFICQATIGEYASASGLKVLITQNRVGKPLMPRSIDKRLCTMSRFFRRLQDRPHVVGKSQARRIERRFNPSEAFATPQYLRRLIQPDPRDIDEVIWCKLTYAAATLTEEDYASLWNGYPLSFYKAAALLWVTSARRPNEIIRLQVGCIRRDWDPTMLDENGIPLPGQEAQLCYLHIPANKTKGPYWVPIPRYAADAVERWERERPAKQPKRIDSKDNSLVDFLFSLKNKKMGASFLNATLIPALCRRAGVPEEDARGSITGHRARSTIATMLRRNGLSLEDISEFLGHAKPDMVRAYARTDQFRFGRDINRANDLMRIVEGLIDTRAAKAGKPNVFFFLGRGADGQPRFCGNPAWEKCAHRLACLKCPMYVGASQAARLAERLEAREEIFKFQTKIEMTPQERAAAEGDVETLSSLIEADAHLPPPDPPDDAFRFNTPLRTSALPSLPDPPDLVDLGRQLAALTRDLAAAEKRTDGRNAAIRSLKKRIAEVAKQMAALDQVATLTKASLEMESTSTNQAP